MKVALVTCAHNEDRYIDEWLQYHVKLGFDRIVVIQNRWRYQGSFSHPNVVFVENDGKWNPKWQAHIYTQWSEHLAREGFDFVAAWDVDEFLVVNNCAHDIHNFLALHPNNECIFIQWRAFGDSGQPPPDGTEWSVLKRFTRRDNHIHANGKSIAGVRVHGRGVWVDPHHLRHPKTRQVWRRGVPEAELFHFRNKTRSEYEERFPHRMHSRRINHDRDFAAWNHNEIPDFRARDFLYPPDDSTPGSYPGVPAVDMAFILCYSGYRKQRYRSLMAELDRVGFTVPKQVVWTFPTPYDAWERENFTVDGYLKKHIGWWSCTKGHYTIIKTAYELGCRRILIMEDDVRFLRDAGYVLEACSHLPMDWDILMLDHHGTFGGGGSTPGNRYWRPITGGFSTGAYVINRRAMERLVAKYEEPAAEAHAMCHPSDLWLNKRRISWDFRLFASRKLLAIQDLQIRHTVRIRETKVTYYGHDRKEFQV